MSAPSAAAPAIVTRRGPSLAGAIRSEMLKLRRQVMAWVVAGLILAATALGLIALQASTGARSTLAAHPLEFYFSYLSGVQILFGIGSGIFLLLVTARLVGMEYASGTIRIVLARGTPRLQLLAAQGITVLVAGAGLLLVFVGLAASVLYVLVTIWQGGFSTISSLPGVAWQDTWLTIALGFVSEVVCVLLAMAAAVVGRSLAFGVGVALGWFPADNFGTIVMLLLRRSTHMNVWQDATQWFLGPNLNNLGALVVTDHAAGSAFAVPLVPETAGHAWLVVGLYAAIFLVLSVALTWYRDVLE